MKGSGWLVGWFVAVMTFSNIKQQDGKDDGWIMVMILNDPACQMSEV